MRDVELHDYKIQEVNTKNTYFFTGFCRRRGYTQNVKFVLYKAACLSLSHRRLSVVILGRNAVKSLKHNGVTDILVCTYKDFFFYTSPVYQFSVCFVDCF